MEKTQGNFISQPGADFPVDCETLDYLQTNVDMAAILGNLVGDKTILRGCDRIGETNQWCAGYVFLRSRDCPDGEVLHFEGGNASAGVYVKQEDIAVTTQGEKYPKAYSRRSLACGSGSENYTWGDFVAPRVRLQDSEHRFVTDDERSKWNAKQSAIKNVVIDDFDAFDPNTLGLAVGEFCSFSHYSTTSDKGRPCLNPTAGSNDPFFAFYSWAGTITKVNTFYFRLTAYAGVIHQVAARVYDSSWGTWTILPEYMSGWTDYTVNSHDPISKSAYVKFPSGLMLQWGHDVTNDSDRSIKFPLAFSSVHAAFVTPDLARRIEGDTSDLSGRGALLPHILGFAPGWLRIFTQSAGNTSNLMVKFHWMVIGTWK